MTQAYLRNRYYDPSIGRFTTEDPVKDGDNWYVYCGNNPVNAVDPWGLDSVIFVSSNMSEQANARKQYYTDKYDTASYVIEVESAEEFVDRWNEFFIRAKDNNINIDAIEVISHGSIDGEVGKDSTGTAYSTGYIYFTDSQKNKLYARKVDNMGKGDRSTGSLISVTAKELNFGSCNSANPDTYNIVYGFMSRVKAGTYSGFDGGAKWNEGINDHERGGGEKADGRPFYQGGEWFYVKRYQHTWWKYVEKIDGAPIRDRIGRRYFSN